MLTRSGYAVRRMEGTWYSGMACALSLRSFLRLFFTVVLRFYAKPVTVVRLFYGLLALASEMDTVVKPSSKGGCSYRFHLSGDNSRNRHIKGSRQGPV